MKKLINKKYEEYNLYAFEEKYIEICKMILDKKYLTIKELKNTPRNYISLIEINGKRYVYKEPRNEYKLIQRKIMTILKKGESLNTLINVNKVEEMGIDSLAKVYAAVNKRKNGMIIFSFILMEYIEETNNLEMNIEKKSIAVEKLKEIHKLGYYHGDFNPSNIILTKDKKIKLIDTQLKKDYFFNYRRHYDMITMQYDSYKELKYPYTKNIFYYLAFGVKKLKKLKRKKRMK